MKHNISKSKEDYLEAVLVKIQTKVACRMTDIANYLGYSRASVSVALKKLEDEHYVCRDDWRIDNGLTAVNCCQAASIIIEDLNLQKKFHTVLVLVGDCSFGIYLSHIMIMKVLAHIPYYSYIPYIINSIIVLLISLVCVISRHCYEK